MNVPPLMSTVRWLCRPLRCMYNTSACLEKRFNHCLVSFRKNLSSSASSGRLPLRANKNGSQHRSSATVLSALRAQREQCLHTLASRRTFSSSDDGSVTHLVNARGRISSPALQPIHKPEVLAPVGGWAQMRAAVESGADAVYFGLTDFNARARASNFSPEDLPAIMEYLHGRGVKGFVTLNVLVYDSELADVEARVRQMAEAGVDAVIVQDLGAVVLMGRVAPGLPLHGSTQMSITSAEGAAFAGERGVERVVVGRELSVRDIAKVVAGSPQTEVEAFVHGALCVSYSGQCFSSEAWGGRSANRGQCAQACRMPYGLLVGGEVKVMGDQKYLLSPSDLMAVDAVPGLIAAGVSCFKIEGRLKGPEYVALTTQVYRRAVDAAWAALTGTPTPTHARLGRHHQPAASDTPTATEPLPAVGRVGSAALASARAAVAMDPRSRQDLEQVFARGQDAEHSGLTPGFLEGTLHQRVVRGRAPRHRGVYIGKVVQVTPTEGGVRSGSQTRRGGARGLGARREGGRWAATEGARVVVELAAPLKRGDGLVFDAGAPEEREEGGQVYDLLDGRGHSMAGEVAPWSAASSTAETTSDAASGAKGAHQAQSRSHSDHGGARGDGMGHSPVRVTVVFGNGQVDPSRVKPGQLVWRNKDNALEAAVRASYESLPASRMRRSAVTAAAIGQLGTPLTLVLRDGQGHEVSVSTASTLTPATSRKLAPEDVDKAVGFTLDAGLPPQHPLPTDAADALGVTPGIGTLALSGPIDKSGLAFDQGLFMAASEIKSVRRAAAEALLEARRRHTKAEGLADLPVLPAMLSEIAARSTHSSTAGCDDGSRALGGRGNPAPSLRVLCRSPAQVAAALEVPWLTEVVLDFLEVQGLKEAVKQVQAAGRTAIVATPRVLKPDEERLVHFYLRLRSDGLLLRSAGLAHQLAAMGGAGATLHGLTAPDGSPLAVPRLQGDFSLNAANALAADAFLSPRGALERLAPTHDLSAAQICGLAKALGGGKEGQRAATGLEVIIHHHLPIFHTEHCVFCRFLSTGNSYKDCGKPCERHTVHLRDQGGADHLVLADMGCRNTVFNAQAQSGVFFTDEFLRAGVHSFRVELVDEPSHVVAPLLQGYRDVLDGARTPKDLWQWLQTLPDANGHAHGVSAGSLGASSTRAERPRADMKPTAAALKAAQQMGGMAQTRSLANRK